MNWRLVLLRIHLPVFANRRGLMELYRRTARAFGCELPDQDKRAYPEMLISYAEFTKDRALATLADGGSPEEIVSRLRREALEMGELLRQRLRLRTEADIRTALRLVYRGLGIDLRVSPAGQVVVRGCFFSKYYPAPVCRLISALDDGLVEGLTGGRRLRFTQRITEGAACCRATIDGFKY